MSHGSYPKQDYNTYERKKMDGWMDDGQQDVLTAFPSQKEYSGLVGEVMSLA